MSLSVLVSGAADAADVGAAVTPAESRDHLFEFGAGHLVDSRAVAKVDRLLANSSNRPLTWVKRGQPWLQFWLHSPPFSSVQKPLAGPFHRRSGHS